MELNADRLLKINSDLNDIVHHYVNQSAIELADKFNVNLQAKSGYSTLTKKMISYSGSEFLNQIEALGEITIKTIRLDKYGQLKESISLPVFQYCDIVNETWKTSDIRNYFLNRVFAFVVFRANEKKQYLSKIVIWKMPSSILEEHVKNEWQKMYELLSKGTIVKYIDNNGRYFSYFPTSSESTCVHVRPHAQNRNDTFPLPVPDRLTGLIHYPKHSFWLNRAYILKIISEGI